MIISFYSYKGGVGRSQLCANIASYLCHKEHKKVLLLDWDFESPGLHYFFSKNNTDIKTSGTIELLKNYTDMLRKEEIIEIEDYKYFDNTSIIPITSEGDGKIDLIPAGNYSIAYFYKVQSFDWFEFYEMLDGKSYIEELKKWLKTLDYDFIFIDSGPGITDYSGVCNIQLPDTNIIVSNATDQSIDGCKRVTDQIINSEYTAKGFRKDYVIPILSRINQAHPLLEYWEDKFTDSFYNVFDKENTKESFNSYLQNTILFEDPAIVIWKYDLNIYLFYLILL
jgi:MinD-like ATPase involved in chromosome partitioning or flagellar assembly